MNKLFRGALAAVLATTVALVLAVPALAAPVPWQRVDVTMHYEQGTPIVLVTGSLPEGTKLPATVELAVPSGGTHQWAGEILGGDPSADPTVQYTTRTEGGMTVYSFTLTKARIGQVEISLPSAMAFDGTTYRSALAWTAVTDVPEVSLFARVPAGSQVTEPAENAGMTEGPPGYSYYTRVAKDVKAGTALDLVFAYTAPATPAGGAAGSPAPAQNNTLPTILITALVLGAFALVVMGIRGKMAESRGAAGVSDDDIEDDTESVVAPTKAKAATKTAAAASHVAADEPVAEDAVEQPRRGSGKAPLVIGLVVVALVIGGFIAVDRGTSPQQFEGTFVRDFGNLSACSNKVYPIAIPEGESPEAASEKLFTSLQSLGGLGKVTVDVAASTIDVAYCVSSVSEGEVHSALAASGYLDPSAPAPAPAAEATSAAPATATP